MVRIKSLGKNHITILAIAAFVLISTAQPVLAADIEMTSVSSGVLKVLVQNIATILGSIGAGVILIYGMIHTFGVASAGKNATKRAMAMESLGYVFFSIFIFFALSKIGGVIRGLAESVN